MTPPPLEEKELHKCIDIFPTEHYNAIVLADAHYFDKTNLWEKAERIEKDAKALKEASKAFNASDVYLLGDMGGVKAISSLLEKTNFDRAVLLEGDEDRKGGTQNRDAGWSWENKKIEDKLEAPLNFNIQKAEEFRFSPFKNYDVCLDHFPRSPDSGEERFFEYDWFADDLYYQRGKDNYSEAFDAPRVAIAGHNHAPYVRTLNRGVAINAGSSDMGYPTVDEIPDQVFYGTSFSPEEVHTAMIDIEDMEIVEYDIFRLAGDAFNHLNLYSDTGKVHPDKRFNKESLPDGYDSLTDGVKRIKPVMSD